jgi:hypothetical protein
VRWSSAAAASRCVPPKRGLRIGGRNRGALPQKAFWAAHVSVSLDSAPPGGAGPGGGTWLELGRYGWGGRERSSRVGFWWRAARADRELNKWFVHWAGCCVACVYDDDVCSAVVFGLGREVWARRPRGRACPWRISFYLSGAMELCCSACESCEWAAGRGRGKGVKNGFCLE